MQQRARMWAAVEAGAEVITASARLAEWLRAEHDRRQQAAGRRAWAAPLILTLGAWLDRAWAQAGAALRLSAAQEQWLWEQVIADSEVAGEALLDRAATARAAAQAWRLAQAWELDWADAEWEQNEDTAAFRGWARTLLQRCRTAGWITAAELGAAVAAELQRGAIPAPARVWLAGFDELTPQQTALVAALQAASTAVESENQWEEQPASALQLAAAPEAATEMRWAAAWARRQVEALTDAGPSAASPRAPLDRIPVGIVVPGLEGARGAIERIFLEALHPGREPWLAKPRAFHLSLGLELGQYPVVAAAGVLIETLAAGEAAVEMGELGQLLRTPFWLGGDHEAGRRARLEFELRAEHWTRLRLSELGARASRCPLLRTALERGRAARRAWPRRQSYTGWTASFEKALEALGWPGERGLNSAEFQTVEAWREALGELGALDQLAGPVSAAEAWRRLRQIVAARVFQPRAIVSAPVQIMGWLEAAGLEFEQLWVMGLHDAAVPAAAAPHPFLPLRWQRERAMPHATPAREAAFAVLTLERLRRSARELVVSFPAAEGEIELRPSPLVAGAEAWSVAEAPTEPRRPAAAIEAIEDESGPAAAGEELGRGGSKIFTEQAACPFRAFAHLRLGAGAPEATPAGLAALERGNLLHEVLKRIWERLGDQAALLALTEDGVAKLAAECAAAAAAEAERLRERPRLAEMEQQRLRQLAVEWLAKERKRIPFRVMGREEERNLEWGGLGLKLRLDRVDELESGERVLIDYKSGSTNTGHWNTPRPAAPQLPLYLVTDPEWERVAAIAFAQLQPGAMSLKAMAREKGVLAWAKDLSKRLGGWNGQVEAWRQELETLAGDYIAGRAAVNPKTKQSCEHCDATQFCRVGEMNFQARWERLESDREAGEENDGD